MDFLKNFISQLHKSLHKCENKINNNARDSAKDVSLKEPVDIANNNLKSSVDVEVSVTQGTNACGDVKIVKKLNKEGLTKTERSSKNTKETHETTLDINESKNSLDLRLLEKLLNNTSMSITKVRNNDRSVDSENENTQNVNTSIENVVFASPLLISEDIGNGEISTNNAPKELETESTNDQSVTAINEVNKLAESHSSKDPSNSSEIKNIDDQTKQSIKEFDDVLAEVLRKDNSRVDDAEAPSIEDINDILQEKLDADTTYNFHKINHMFHYDNGIINNYNNEIKTNSSSNIVVEHNMLDTVITRLCNDVSRDEKVEDDIEIISLSSDDTPPDVEIYMNFKAIKNETIYNVFKEKDIKDNIDVISLSSDDTPNTDEILHLNETTFIESDVKETQNVENTEGNDKLKRPQDTISINSEEDSEDCGYHSSDFEFISEGEAKMDGFIINFDPSRHNLGANVKEHNSNINKGAFKIHKVPNAPGPASSRNVGRHENYKRQMDFVIDKRYKENYALPEENEFLNMFHGIIPAMPPCEIHFLENKSVRTRAPMLVQYEGIGFDMNLAMQRVEASSDEEYRDEAEESLKKILEMYPVENTMRKRRRRH